MRFSPSFSIGLGVVAGVILVRQRRTRQAAERFAAAALESLLRAVDANDPQTGAHVRRVARYALVIADAVGLGENELRSVERIALFHDIGKIDEALFDIVHESDQLTREERRAIAKHPMRGAQVLAPLGRFYPDLEAGVLSHHERWDGNGYPRRLKGRQIPFAARIVTIADTFDAITHSRRYRNGQSVARAAQAIAEGRGTQFDPELVDLVLSPPVLEALERVRAAPGPRLRRAARARHGEDERRVGKQERDVPDVTFRWRSESPEWRTRDLERRSSRS